MAAKKVIAVVGATGAQGGGLVRAILNDPSGEFAVRAITRDANSSKAQELARLGAELVSANVDDVESLKRAFAGAYGAFCVTFFWEHFSAEKEIDEGAQHGRGGEGRRRSACHLVHPGRAPAGGWRSATSGCQPCTASTRRPHFDGKAKPTGSSLAWGSR